MARIGVFETQPGAGDETSPLPVSGTVTANPTPLAAPTANSGAVTAPVAAAVVADTGALAVGSYRVEIALGFSGVLAAGKHIVAEHRDAANTGNVHQLALCPAGAGLALSLPKVVVAANERIRAVIGAVAGEVGSVAHASIRAYLL